MTLVALHLAMPIDGIRVFGPSPHTTITESPSGWRVALADGRVFAVPTAMAVSEWRDEAPPQQDTTPETPKAKAKR